MLTKIILAGFGGQGVIASGKLLAVAAMKEGLNVTHFPAYGAEMRGGTCNCSVIISDKPIASPVISTPDVLIVLNNPSLDKYKDKCATGAKLLINSSMSAGNVDRNDVEKYMIDAGKIAEELGNPRGTNMIILGAFAKITGLVKVETLANSITDVFHNFKPAVVEVNVKSLQKGYDLF